MKHLSLEGIIRTRYDNNPVFYYKDHYAGLTRWRLQLANYVLWELISKRGMMHEIPTTKNDFGKNAYAFYKKHYNGLSPYQLRKENPGLYNRLRMEGKIPLLPRRNMRQALREVSPYGLDAWDYYQKHFRGYSRGELKKVAPGLYGRLHNDDFLKRISTKNEEEIRV